MATFISQETINAVQNSADIVSIIGEYTKLERRGSDWWGCCPFHNEKTASFHVEPDKKFYYCFGCHAGGDVIKFIMEQEKVSYSDAIATLAKRTGIEIKYTNGTPEKENPQLKIIEQYTELYERTASMFHYFLLETPQGKSALEYITSRGISLETIKKFKLGFAPIDRKWLKNFLLKKNFSNEFLLNSGLFSKKYSDVAFFSNRLMFPIFNRRGQVVALGGRQLSNDPNSPKYLNSGDLIQYKKGETLYAFNFAKKAIREAKKVIFCEGYMDCIAYHQCGIEYAVAPLGTALTEMQIKIIRPFVEEVLLSFDSDGAGQKATMRAILMLRKENITVRIIQLTGGKDPAEIMQKLGPQVLTNQVSNAILDSDFLLSRLGAEFPIDTPEGKTKASLVYFSYVDALQSDIQKESCLEQLCQAFNLKPEAVKRDFRNRNQARERLNSRQPLQSNQHKELKIDAELRSILVIIANLDKYKAVRTELLEYEFENLSASQLFNILEECFKNETLSLTSILNHCNEPELTNLITKVISLGEFKENNEDAIQDSIQMLKRRNLERKRDDIMSRIRKFNVNTSHDQRELEKLLEEKMELDRKLMH
ncbi:MAG: DNA primase [Treponema sp.]|jgi:DNA primase|nr:DNA primase [Treponema sp.]MBQ5877966.1 DNA primase [Treponema sp.]